MVFQKPQTTYRKLTDDNLQYGMAVFNMFDWITKREWKIL